MENIDIIRAVEQGNLMQLKKAGFFSLFGHQINKRSACHRLILYRCLNGNQAFLSRLKITGSPAPALSNKYAPVINQLFWDFLDAPDISQHVKNY